MSGSREVEPLSDAEVGELGFEATPRGWRARSNDDGARAIVAQAGGRDARTRSMRDLLTDPPASVAHLMEALIVSLGITVLAAPTKVGKTLFWLHVSWALTEGAPLFGRFVVPSPIVVLMLQLELSEATLHERLQALAGELGWSDAAQDRFYVHCARSFLVDQPGSVEELVRVIEACPQRPAVVILDSYNAAVAGDPDRSAEARKALAVLREVQERTGIAWCITSEIRKAPTGGKVRFGVDDLKGSNELAYDADAVLLLRPIDDSRRRLAVHFSAMRHGDAPDNLLLVRDGLNLSLAEAPTDRTADAVVEVLREHVASGGDRGWRALRAVVKEAGLKVSNDQFSDLRKQVLDGID